MQSVVGILPTSESRGPQRFAFICGHSRLNLVACIALNAPLRAGSKITFLDWVNILSVDAPIVAVVWQWFIADLFSTPISLASRFVLGLTVWLAYVADRWLDGKNLPAGSAVTLRHQFAQAGRRPIAIAWLFVFVGNVILALIGLTQREFLFGLGVGVVAIIYLLAVHAKAFRNAVGWVKEAIVAILFALGVGVFVMANVDAIDSKLLLSLLIFTLICWLNCILVSSWERLEDEQQDQTSMAIRWNLTPLSVQWGAPPFAVVLALICLREWGNTLGWVCGAAALSMLSLGLLAWSGGRLSTAVRRVLADVALLSPLVVALLK